MGYCSVAEGVIRKKLLRSIDAVIGMPANLFFGTSIPTTVIILKKNRTTRDVLFIDASNEFTKGKTRINSLKKILIKLLKHIRSVKMWRNMPTLLPLRKSRRMISI